MNPALLQIYHCFPPWLRSVTASFYGHYLRSWRYGPETERLVEEALQREQWSVEQWKKWQEERLAYVLYRAATKVPYYRDFWAKKRSCVPRSSWEYLENWPVLEKDTVRNHPEAFLADDCDARKMYREHTSGTTGKPLQLWWSRKTVRNWYALSEARWRRWYGVSHTDRWAILGGQPIIPFQVKTPPFWVWNAPMKQLYLSSYHLSPGFIPYYLEALKRYRIRYIYAYTSSLCALAHGLLRLRYGHLKMDVVITNAEPLFDYQRKIISAAFQCPVRETYGMAEIVAAAGECGAGKLHLWPEVGWIEVMEDGRRITDGNVGELVCTGLLNEDMPLIRYRVGDRATEPSLGGNCCACGRILPWLQSVEGRNDDVLYTRDGRSIGRLDPVFKDRLPIREAQIIQETLDQVRVRYVPTGEFNASHEASIALNLRQRMGNIEIIFEKLEKAPRESNGKFRPVICNLPDGVKKSHEKGDRSN